MANQTWIVVANSAQAKIFRLVQFPKIEEVTSLAHPESRLHIRDLVSDRPGRAFDRNGTARHAYESKVDPKQVEIDRFARDLAQHLTTACQKGEFGRLYLIAGPSFLGLLRQYLDEQTQALIVDEVVRDIVEQDKTEIERHVAALHR